ncbi:MAG TPA: papain-like cysteine protease family protein [Fimbriiglobus sp.]|jgi:hypothetical protein|nr:papain-like cysteine protease family protein [Fimbriiglobus sp.]
MGDKARIKHNVSAAGMGQSLSTLCWYASYKMMLAWANDTTTDIKAGLAKNGLKWDELRSRGLYPEEFLRAARAVGLYGLGVDFIKSYDWATICERLRTFGPFWCAVDLEDDGVIAPSHAVVVYGADEAMNTVFYMDPYKKPYDGDAEPSGWTLKQFQSNLVSTPYGVQIWP